MRTKRHLKNRQQAILAEQSEASWASIQCVWDELRLDEAKQQLLQEQQLFQPQQLEPVS